jgi:hypothetical protein
MTVKIIEAPYLLCLYPLPGWTIYPEAYIIPSNDGNSHVLLLCKRMTKRF